MLHEYRPCRGRAAAARSSRPSTVLAHLVRDPRDGSAVRLIGERPSPPNITGFAEIAGELLPPASASPEEQQAALEHWHRRLGADFALRGPGGADIARTSDDLIAIGERDPEAEQHVMTPRGPAIRIALADGR